MKRPPTLVPPAVPKNGVRWTLRCGCARLTMVPSAAMAAPVRCLACGQVFVSEALAEAVAATRPPAWNSYAGWLAPLAAEVAVRDSLMALARRHEEVPCPRCGQTIIDAITPEGDPDPVDAARTATADAQRLVLSMRTGKRPVVQATDEQGELTWTRHRCS